MKFRLKVGPYFGYCEGGSKQFLQTPQWMLKVRDNLGTSLKDTKALADHLRGYIADMGGHYKGASIVVNDSQFPFLAKHEYIPSNSVIEFINEDVAPGLACMVTNAPFELDPITDGRPVQIIKDAMGELIKINAWKDVRRLAEVLMDIEDEQPE